jgi:adenine phosphoribosyltransferase
MRKPGKLPSITHAIDYELEYGTNSLEIHTDALDENDIVLLHDDLLATGGSAKAAIDLIELFKPKKIYSDFLIELEFLNGREKLKDYSDIHTLIKF